MKYPRNREEFIALCKDMGYTTELEDERDIRRFIAEQYRDAYDKCYGDKDWNLVFLGEQALPTVKTDADVDTFFQEKLEEMDTAVEEEEEWLDELRDNIVEWWGMSLIKEEV